MQFTSEGSIQNHWRQDQDFASTSLGGGFQSIAGTADRFGENGGVSWTRWTDWKVWDLCISNGGTPKFCWFPMNSILNLPNPNIFLRQFYECKSCERLAPPKNGECHWIDHALLPQVLGHGLGAEDSYCCAQHKKRAPESRAFERYWAFGMFATTYKPSYYPGVFKVLIVCWETISLLYVCI